MENPNAMNITKTTLKTNKNVLNTKAVSAETSAHETQERNKEGIKKENMFLM